MSNIADRVRITDDGGKLHVMLDGDRELVWFPYRPGNITSFSHSMALALGFQQGYVMAKSEEESI